MAEAGGSGAGGGCSGCRHSPDAPAPADALSFQWETALKFTKRAGFRFCKQPVNSYSMSLLYLLNEVVCSVRRALEFTGVECGECQTKHGDYRGEFALFVLWPGSAR